MRKDIAANLASQIKSAQAFCESEIARMTEEANQTNRTETYRVAARDMHEVYVQFMREGFTEEQAWELVKIITAK